MIEESRIENADALDYEGQQNRGDNSDLNEICRKIFWVVSNIFHLLSVDEYWSSLTGCWERRCSRVRCTR